MAQTIIGDIDRLGISVVQPSGGDSIPPMSKLLSQFGIAHIGVLDKEAICNLGLDGLLSNPGAIGSVLCKTWWTRPSE